MFRDSMERLSGRERPMTSYNNFEELAKEFPPNARVATEVGFKEMFSDSAQETIKEWMTTQEGQQILDNLATTMDKAISSAMKMPFPPETKTERVQQARADYLRKTFLNAIEESLPEIDMTDPNINWDEAVREGRKQIGEEDPDMSNVVSPDDFDFGSFGGKETSKKTADGDQHISDEDLNISEAA